MTIGDGQAFQNWQIALQTTVADAIEHLQVLIFDDGWQELRAAAGSDEAALRESVASYERELARLFGFVRASGALADAVAWSTLKTDFRRAALDANTEISLRTALETGLYAAELIPLADHAGYRAWATALMGFLASRAATGPTAPGPDAEADDRLQWAYDRLADLEDHTAFNAAFLNWLNAEYPPSTDRDAIVADQQRLLALPRFDIVLNTSLRWLSSQPPA
ncbi:MAG TPA: hypothetical protein VFV93_02210 [Thermomicrobiales bacterium]|nr:hypothetical protein [Thermomicrobiales bacterium]